MSSAGQPPAGPPVLKMIESALTISSGVITLILLLLDPGPTLRRWLFWSAVGIIALVLIVLLFQRSKTSSATQQAATKPRVGKLTLSLSATSIVFFVISVLLLVSRSPDATQPPTAGPRPDASAASLLSPWVVAPEPPDLSSGTINGVEVAAVPTLRVRGLGCDGSTASLPLEQSKGRRELRFQAGVADDSPEQLFVSVRVARNGVTEQSARLKRGQSSAMTVDLSKAGSLTIEATALTHFQSTCLESQVRILMYEASLK